MENATKALLIAAAVLIAILIITLGLVVYNKASETVNSAGDLSEYQIQQINEKFRKYEGESVSGSDVNAMIQTVFNHNMAQEDNTTCVSIEDKTSNNANLTASTENTTSPKKVSTGSRYKVTCTFGKESKLITKITIEAAGSGSGTPE